MTVLTVKYASLFDSLWQILPESDLFSPPVGGRQVGGNWIDAHGVDAAVNQAEYAKALMRAKVRRSIELLTNNSSERHYAQTRASALLQEMAPLGLSKNEHDLHISCREMLENIFYFPQEGDEERVAEAFSWFNAA